MNERGLRIELQNLPTDALRCDWCAQLIPSARDMDGDEFGYEWVPILMSANEPLVTICRECASVRLHLAL